jgi:phosphoribosyl-AMP cyclohydrolase / phosphoribosyl-ATP pyrophosphohydrolase
MNETPELDLGSLDFEKGGGCVSVVAVDAVTGAVLMVAYADREALVRTLASGEMHYRSRTRGLWHKGATSGCVQRVVSLIADCDGDAVLAVVEQEGHACHTGQFSCFTVGVDAGAVESLARVIGERASGSHTDSSPSYTRRLLADRNLRLKKLGEEAAELVTACADGDAQRAAEEAADLVYHALVALQATGASWRDVERVLWRRGRARLRPP